MTMNEDFFARSRVMWQDTLKHFPDHETAYFWQPLVERHQQIAVNPLQLQEWERHFEAYIRRMDPYYKAFVDWRHVQMSKESDVPHFVVTYKDNIDIAGFPTRYGNTSGFRLYPTQSAQIVERLHEKRFTCIGKVATTEFSIGNESWCINPRFPYFSPSGSSTGSAVAVASGFCDLSIGTDSASSIRLPAGNCGIVGLRLTPYSALTKGIFSVSPSMDSVGLMTRTVADLAYIWQRETLRTLAHSTPRVNHDQKSLKIGIVDNYCKTSYCHHDIVEAFNQLDDRLRQAGHVTEHVNLKWWKYRRVAWTLLSREVSDVHKNLQFSIPIQYQSGTLAALSVGKEVTDEAYNEAKELQQIAQAMANNDLTRDYDVLLLPLDPDLPRNLMVPAPKQTIPESSNIKEETLDYATIASFAGIPALTLPIAISPSGAPIAVQVFAAQREEEKLIQAGLLIEEIIRLV